MILRSATSLMLLAGVTLGGRATEVTAPNFDSLVTQSDCVAASAGKP